MTTATSLRTTGAITLSELRLNTREWGVLVLGFAFPPLMFLVLSGVFASDDGAGFAGINGASFYVVSYLAVPAASLALTGLPVQLAAHRERGVLKRYAASGVRPLQVVSAQAVVGLVTMVLGALVVLGVAAATRDIPEPRHLWPALGVLAIGMLMLLTLGIAIGLATTSVRVANAVGLLVFFPVFLLGGGGPPPGVMPEGMQDVADLLPLTPVTRGMRDAWLSGAGVGDDVRTILVWWAVGAAAVVALALRGRRA
jgi:ABC-2 type transport system permease protein